MQKIIAFELLLLFQTVSKSNICFLVLKLVKNNFLAHFTAYFVQPSCMKPIIFSLEF